MIGLIIRSLSINHNIPILDHQYSFARCSSITINYSFINIQPQYLSIVLKSYLTLAQNQTDYLVLFCTDTKHFMINQSSLKSSNQPFTGV